MKKLIAVTLLELATCVLAVTAPALTITVTNTNDSGPGSLRQALAIANNGDTITFAVSGTITLTSGELLVGNSITISGPGASNLAIDGYAQAAVFDISSAGPVTISGLTITDGNIGGGIDNYSVLTMNACIVSGNYSSGIANYGALTMNDCTISDNNAGSPPSVGGGIYSNATVTLNNCTVSNNWASASGGGIYNDAWSANGSATVILNNCTVSDNTAANNDGGGICNFVEGAGVNMTGTVVINNSTLSNNTAYIDGGAISSTSGASNGNAAAILHVSNSTFSGNSAPGGGIYNSFYASIATVTLRNTILKAGALGQNIQNDSGTIASQGYNLSSDNGGGYLSHQGDQINTDPLLGPLQDNGGPTFTHALLPGSPAINAGDPSFTPPPSYDQRGPGFDRVRNGRIDIGAFEVQEATPTATPIPTATATATATPTSTPTATPTATATSTPTPTSTPRPTPTPKVRPTPRVRPTPQPR